MRFKPLICDLSFLEMIQARLLLAFQACTWQKLVFCFDVLPKLHMIAFVNRVAVQFCFEGIVEKDVGVLKAFQIKISTLKASHLPIVAAA